MRTKERVTKPTGKMSRRLFIRSAGQAAAAMTLLKAASITQATADKGKAAPSGKKIRVGIIGCGSLSGKYIPDMKAVLQVQAGHAKQ